MDSRPASLLKYRFANLQQLHNHLHVVDGRTLFFLREARATLASAARVVIEFSFSDSEQVTTLRGQVLARIEGEGGQTGVWLEFPDSKLARRLDQGILLARHQRRLGCDMMVELKLGNMPYLGRLIDVSLHGMRIVGAAGVRAGNEVEVRIMGAEPPLPALLGRSEVVRAEPGGDLAVRFVRTDVSTRIASSKLYSAVQEGWQKAPEGAHSPLCCKNGHVQEPPLPHMKSRT